MCLTPNNLPDGTQVACRRCKLCLANRVNDLVGRCLAEQAISDAAFSVTLTYAGDTVQTVVHCLKDIQNLVKRMRKAGMKVRYICAGEFGEKFGRVHWHFVGFWRGSDLPEVPLERRFDWGFWPHGYSYFQKPDYKGFAYAMKYALKDAGPGSVRPLVMSKKPPLGHDFFIAMADDMARKGLPLHSPAYQFKDVRKADGSIRQFWLQGRMRELFVERYLSQWAMLYVTGADIPLVFKTDWLHGPRDEFGDRDTEKGFLFKLRKRHDPDDIEAEIIARPRPTVYDDPDNILQEG